MSNPIAPFAIQFGEGTALEIPTGEVTIKAATKETSGSLTVLEFLIGPKDGPALHTHLREPGRTRGRPHRHAGARRQDADAARRCVRDRHAGRRRVWQGEGQRG